MRSVHTLGSAHQHLARTSPARLGLPSTGAGDWSSGVSFTHPPSCGPSLHGRYPASTLPMAALTPAPRGSRPFAPDAGLFGSSTTASVRSAANHPGRPDIAFARYPSACRAPRPFPTGLGFVTCKQTRRRHRPNRVCHPADRSFTSSCSRPRLAATPFPSVTGWRAWARQGLAPCC